MQVQQAVSITKALQSQILILDGAMGTLIQNSLLDKEDKSVYDLLNLTKPELITRIHTDYLLAGAHILKTNTFNANAISLANFGLESLAYRLNFSGAQIAQQAILEFNKTQTKNKEVHFVAGCMGPTSQMRPLSFDSNTQFQKNMDFSKLKNAYYTQAKGLMEGGVDVFLIETIVDLYTAKAALYAIEDLFKEKQKQIPILCSLTLTKEGNCFSGESLAHSLSSLSKFSLLSIGLNCMEAQIMGPYLEQIASQFPLYVSAHPNAGLPNTLGQYSQSPAQILSFLTPLLKKSILHIVGGCCGTTPAYTKAVADTLHCIRK